MILADTELIKVNGMHARIQDLKNKIRNSNTKEFGIQDLGEKIMAL